MQPLQISAVASRPPLFSRRALVFAERPHAWPRVVRFAGFSRQLRRDAPLALVMVLTAFAMAVAAHMFGGHNFHHTWRAAHRFLFRRRRTWLPHGPEGTALLAALIVAALAAPQRRWRHQPTPRIRRRPIAAPLQYSAPPQTPAERREAEVQEAFSNLRQLIQEGDAALAAIKLETWGQGGRPSRALRRAELQILLVEAARTRKPEPALLREMGKELSKLGVPLDWSLEHDCSENFGRYALDAALEAAVKEARSERAALTLLTMGQGSGSGDTSQLDVNPLFRAAAGQGMTELLLRLVKECGADVNSKDPLFGATALDRAADAGKERAALRLLQLGADPGAGRGVDYLLARLSPKVRAQLPRASATPRIAPKGELDEDEFGAVRDALRVSEASALAKLRGRRLSAVQLSQLMDDSARSWARCKHLKPRQIDSILVQFRCVKARVGILGDKDSHIALVRTGKKLLSVVAHCTNYDTCRFNSHVHMSDLAAPLILTGLEPLRRSAPEPAGAKAVQTYLDLLELQGIIAHSSTTTTRHEFFCRFQQKQEADFCWKTHRSENKTSEGREMFEHQWNPELDTDSTSTVAKAPKAPRSTVPPPEPWMGRLLPDAAEPGAPAITGAFFGGFGAFLGVLRGAAVALLTDRFPDLPRSRAFAIGFAASAPWYVSLLGISGVLSVYSARAERAGRPAQLELSESHPACAARQHST
ncbi:unnamed protein product [Symbiodinium necroappetens]|uniref:Uncharacterized protein n=1 Tax=Symbiodinium necroappetens TaxID=1628268 RepID=A0A812WUH4_9DINO|nr:unnamed protein product [Symbiodinium necroappetens]